MLPDNPDHLAWTSAGGLGGTGTPYVAVELAVTLAGWWMRLSWADQVAYAGPYTTEYRARAAILSQVGAIWRAQPDTQDDSR